MFKEIKIIVLYCQIITVKFIKLLKLLPSAYFKCHESYYWR